MAETLNIYQKLAKVRKSVEVVQRNKSGYGYKYVSDDVLLAKISGLMDKYALSLLPSIVPGTFHVEPYHYVKVKKGVEEPVNELIVYADMKFTWIDNDSPENKVIVDWALVGHQSDASQSLGSALTYSYRYFILKFFGVATPEDDPDSWRSKQKEAEMEEDEALAAQIISALDIDVRSYLATHSEKTEEVKSLFSKYAKNGDYLKIKDSVLANKLAQDFMNLFINNN